MTAGNTEILPPCVMLPVAGENEVNAFTPFVNLEQKKESFLFSIRFRGNDEDDKCVRSWCAYLQRPPPNKGAMVSNSIFSAFTLGTAGSVITAHYAYMQARDGNGATDHYSVKRDAAHTKFCGEANGNHSGKSATYW